MGARLCRALRGMLRAPGGIDAPGAAPLRF